MSRLSDNNTTQTFVLSLRIRNHFGSRVFGLVASVLRPFVQHSSASALAKVCPRRNENGPLQHQLLRLMHLLLEES